MSVAVSVAGESNTNPRPAVQVSEFFWKTAPKGHRPADPSGESGIDTPVDGLCHRKVDDVGGCGVGQRDAAHLLCPPPVSSRTHPACNLALSPVHIELPRRRGAV